MRDIFGALLVLIVPCVAQDSRPADPPDQRVAVTLKNGEKLTGIAVRGVLCERLDRGHFAPCEDPKAAKTGIRLWYYRDLDGYVFLENPLVTKIETLGPLSRDQSRDLVDAVGTAREGREAANRERVAAKRKAAESRPAPAPDVEGPPAEPKPDPNDLTEEERALLAKFPPESGWSPEKFGEIKRRMIVLDVYPNPAEQEFLDHFPAWRSAVIKHAAKEAAKPDAGKPKLDDPPAGG
ncbi:MAG TPA: hypothetical protein VEI02_04010 [Planctomycetota bacterium]|nr:hypothetical protein [Planctomycetota bacterium]